MAARAAAAEGGQPVAAAAAAALAGVKEAAGRGCGAWAAHTAAGHHARCGRAAYGQHGRDRQRGGDRGG